MKSEKTDIVTSTSSYSRLLRSSVYMYCRTFFTIIISFYATRVLMEKLGVDDYGLYMLVSGLSVIFSFLNVPIESSMVRFIGVAVGGNNSNEVDRSFTWSLNGMLLISIIIFVASEIVGVYLVNYQLKIPEDRLAAANWVFQFSIISFVVGVALGVYNSLILVYEKFSFYAYRDIVVKVLRLGIIYIMAISPGDKLIVYAILYVAVSLGSSIASVVYAHIKLRKIRYVRGLRLHGSKALMKYSASQMLISFVSIVSTQIWSFIVNAHLRLEGNASWGISMQFQGAIYGFLCNITTPAGSQIIKTYGALQITRMKSVVNNTMRLLSLMSACVIIPFAVNMQFSLDVWLGDVPRYTISFCLMSLWVNYISSLYMPISYVVSAEGNIFKYQVLSSIIIFLGIPMAFVLSEPFGVTYAIFVSIVATNALRLGYTIIYLNRKSLLNTKDCFVVALKGIIIIITGIVVAYLIRNNIGCGDIGKAAISSITGWGVAIPLSWFILLSRRQRDLVLDRLNRVLHNKKLTLR